MSVQLYLCFLMMRVHKRLTLMPRHRLIMTFVSSKLLECQFKLAMEEPTSLNLFH